MDRWWVNLTVDQSVMHLVYDWAVRMDSLLDSLLEEQFDPVRMDSLSEEKFEPLMAPRMVRLIVQEFGLGWAQWLGMLEVDWGWDLVEKYLIQSVILETLEKVLALLPN